MPSAGIRQEWERRALAESISDEKRSGDNHTKPDKETDRGNRDWEPAAQWPWRALWTTTPAPGWTQPLAPPATHPSRHVAAAPAPLTLASPPNFTCHCTGKGALERWFYRIMGFLSFPIGRLWMAMCGWISVKAVAPVIQSRRAMRSWHSSVHVVFRKQNRVRLQPWRPLP